MRSLCGRCLPASTLLLLALPAAGQVSQASRLTGRVLDEEARPLEDVLVTVTLAGGAGEHTDITKRRGRFKIELPVSDDAYRVRFEKEGYRTLEGPVEIPAGATGEGDWTLYSEAAATELGHVAGSLEAQLAATIYNEAAAALREGREEEALATFHRALEKDPLLTQAYPVTAALHFERQEYGQVVSLCDRLLEIEPAPPRCLEMRYDALLALGDAERAPDALDALLAHLGDENAAKRAFNAGLAFARESDWEPAKERLGQALEADPSLAPALTLLGDIAMATEDLEGAIAFGRRLVELDPESEKGYSLLFRAYEATGRSEEAAEAWRAMAEVDPDAVIGTRLKHGNDLFEAGDNEAAIRVLRQVLDVDPENPGVHYTLGLALISSGDHSGGTDHLRRFLELAPDDPDAPTAREIVEALE